MMMKKYMERPLKGKLKKSLAPHLNHILGRGEGEEAEHAVKIPEVLGDLPLFSDLLRKGKTIF
jgi:hypothetical protein